MYTTKTLILALSTAASVAAHGKLAVVTGDAGGNGTGLGILGGVIPGAGPNYQTEPDTTVFWSKNIRTDDDIGYTEVPGKGNNKLTDLVSAMALSGSTLPQVTDGGEVSATYHVVTSDGAGPVEALIDETATAKWSKAKTLTVTTQVPGKNGEISKKGKREVLRRFLVKMGVLSPRATNINEDFPLKLAIPKGTKCTGEISGQKNLCLVKVSNNNANGPFGGVFAVQMASSTSRLTRRVKTDRAE